MVATNHSLCFLTPDIPLKEKKIYSTCKNHHHHRHLDVAKWKCMSALVVFFPLIIRFFAAISFLHNLLLYVTAKLISKIGFVILIK